MPAFQKAKLPPKGRDALRLYLDEQLKNCFGQRGDLETKWTSLMEQQRAALPRGTKQFPWEGAANLEFPLTDMHAMPIYSDFMETLHAPEDYWTIVAKRNDRVEHATPLREFLTAVDRTWLKMRMVNGRALLDQNLLGTAIYKRHWLRDRTIRPRYDPSGRIERVSALTSRPLVEHVPLQYFYLPPEAWSIDPDAPVGGAQWVAQKFFLTPAQLDYRAKMDPSLPAYDAEEVEKVRKFLSTQSDPVDDAIRAQDRYEPWYNEKIELYEIHVRFDADGDGIEEDLEVVYHPPTLSILRAIYPTSLHGKRPFYATRFKPSFGFYGVGVAEDDEWAQTTLTKLLNGLIDNLMVVNTRMYGVPMGSMLTPGEPVFPGKLWPLGPNEQIQEIRLGDIHPSLPQTMAALQQWSDLRQGMSEIRQGDVSSLPSRTPATTIMSMLQQSNKRFDMILSNFRDVHGEIGLRVLQDIAQDYREEPLLWTQFCVSALGEKDAMHVLESLQGVDELESSFGVAVTATSALVNKEAEKQSFIGMMQIVLPMYQQLVQTAGLMMQAPPGTPIYDTAAGSYVAGVELIKRLLERFDVQNPSQYLGNVETIASTLAAQAQGVNPALAGVAGPAQPLAPYPAPLQGAPPGLSPGGIGSLFAL